MRFNAQLSKFTQFERHCQNCFYSFGNNLDEDFDHGSYSCPVLQKLIDSVLWVFNLQDFDNPTAHDMLVWHTPLNKGHRIETMYVRPS